MKLVRYIALPVASTFLLSFDQGFNSQLVMENIQKKGKIIVVTRLSSTTLTQKNNDQVTGPEFDLVNYFSKYINTPVELVVASESMSPAEALQTYNADIVAFGTTSYANQESITELPYAVVNQAVICGAQYKSTDSFDIYLNASQEGLKDELKASFSNANFRSTQKVTPEELVQYVSSKKIDCTLIPSHIVDLNKRFLPDVYTIKTLSKSDNLSWYVSKNDQGLGILISKWFKTVQKAGLIAKISERYYGHLLSTNSYESKVFHGRYKRKLPGLKTVFKKAEKQHGISWKLLSAVAYQESHWNPSAVSFTGVRGIMMLTQNTAKSLGVKDRMNIEESVMGGAKYINQIKAKLPSNIHEPDRTWLALAAYNVGLGHLEDALKLTKSFGKNQTLWKDVKKVLPLLAQKEYYKKLAHGRARGLEPVRYVEKIRNFYDQISQLENNNSVAQDFRIPLFAINN